MQTSIEMTIDGWGGGAFTRQFVRGCGVDIDTEYGEVVRMALGADANKDNMVSLAELYNYIKKNVSADLGQDVQVWPANDNTVVMFRK